VQLTVPLPPVTVTGTVKVWMLAEQVAVVPPLLPVQLQLQGPLPVTLEVVPVVQRFAVGAIVIMVPLAVPHVPLTTERAKVAVMLLAASIVTEQVPVPLHAPDQPVKVLPLLGVAVRVILVPLLNVALPLLLVQVIVPELAVTVPVPVPDLVRERV